jgi:hypothetical protein
VLEVGRVWEESAGVSHLPLVDSGPEDHSENTMNGANRSLTGSRRRSSCWAMAGVAPVEVDLLPSDGVRMVVRSR